MNNLNKRRDELAEKFELEAEPTGHIHHDMYSFKQGFDAAISELKPEIDRLVEALEKIKNLTIWNNNSLEADFHLANDVANEALQKWREFERK